jgi:transposase
MNQNDLSVDLVGIEPTTSSMPWLYHPPYSPDLNPIEKAWSKLKHLLRTARTRTKDALDQAITELLPKITLENAEAWFRLRLGTLQ